jgi:hypothetical protein
MKYTELRPGMLIKDVGFIVRAGKTETSGDKIAITAYMKFGNWEELTGNHDPAEEYEEEHPIGASGWIKAMMQCRIDLLENWLYAEDSRRQFDKIMDDVFYNK